MGMTFDGRAALLDAQQTSEFLLGLQLESTA